MPGIFHYGEDAGVCGYAGHDVFRDRTHFGLSQAFRHFAGKRQTADHSRQGKDIQGDSFTVGKVGLFREMESVERFGFRSPAKTGAGK